MQIKIIAGPVGVPEALFGLGLSYGITADMLFEGFYKSPEFTKLCKTATALAHKQGGHNKFLESIQLWLDINAPRYWWAEFDTYRVGITKQSESTMHTIMRRPLEQDDFEIGCFPPILDCFNAGIKHYNELPEGDDKEAAFHLLKNDLPEGILQRRIVCLNLRTLQNMYMQRKNHRLQEWRLLFERVLMDIQISPYNELIEEWLFGHEEKDS